MYEQRANGIGNFITFSFVVLQGVQKRSVNGVISERKLGACVHAVFQRRGEDRHTAWTVCD